MMYRVHVLARRPAPDTWLGLRKDEMRILVQKRRNAALFGFQDARLEALLLKETLEASPEIGRRKSVLGVVVEKARRDPPTSKDRTRRFPE